MMAVDGHLGMRVLLRITLASAGLSCFNPAKTLSARSRMFLVEDLMSQVSDVLIGGRCDR